MELLVQGNRKDGTQQALYIVTVREIPRLYIRKYACIWFLLRYATTCMIAMISARVARPFAGVAAGAGASPRHLRLGGSAPHVFDRLSSSFRPDYRGQVLCNPRRPGLILCAILVVLGGGRLVHV
jgi:hypothetical protein